MAAAAAAASLADCSNVLKASFNASFKTSRLFYKEKGAVPFSKYLFFFSPPFVCLFFLIVVVIIHAHAHAHTHTCMQVVKSGS